MTTKEKFQISIIGAGNVGYCLSRSLYQNGCVINEIYSRHLHHAESLISQVPGSKISEALDFKGSSSHVFILCIKDDAIEELIEQAKFPTNALVVHTSGIKGMDVFGGLGPSVDFGIFYPLQTFNKNQELSFEKIPIFIEASNPLRLAEMKHLAHTIGAIPNEISSKQKQLLHIAAVFASNFTNHMIASSNQILNKADLDAKHLIPLIKQTIANALLDPDKYLTGPAKRNDRITISKHLELLESSTDLGEMYEVITSSIIDKFNK